MKKVILITGASSGMGKDAALQLIKEGHIVYGGARRVSNMKELTNHGGHILSLDVTSRKSIDEAISKVLAKQERIDVLWNNAGYSLTGAVETITYEEAKHQFDVNLFGVAEMTKAVLPIMRKQKSGLIINTSSIGGKMHMPLLQSWYHASKFALEGWSDALRMELEPFGVDVVLLEPSGVATEFIEVLSQSLVDRAAGSVYEQETQRVAKGLANANNPRNVSPTTIISKAVSKIVNAKKVNTRYVVGKNAKTILMLRRLLSDRMYDKVIRKMTNTMIN